MSSLTHDIPRVCIIILNWNGLKDTIECLTSVFKLDYQNFEVVVVDNGSKDNSSEVIRKIYPQVKLIRNKENVGFTGGNNAGLRYAVEQGADYIWLLNNDTVVETDSLRELIETGEESPGIGMVSPVIYYYDEPSRIQFSGIPEYPITGNALLDQAQRSTAVSLWGTALLIKRGVVERVGYLNEKYFAYGEDEEYSIRVNKVGFWNRIQPRARIYHKDSRSTGHREAPIPVFLRTRNCYFLLTDDVEGIRKFNGVRRYLVYVISSAADLKNRNLKGSLEACFEGVWAAFCGIGGSWEKRATVPIWFIKIFYLFCSWHPYFWINLLQADRLFLSCLPSNIRSKLRTFKRRFTNGNQVEAKV
jgi:GT2 family glycosyltransferase